MDVGSTGDAISHDPNKAQDIASILKTITALTVFRLLQEHEYDVDRKLQQCVPSLVWTHGSGDVSKGELSAFLTHTSGIPGTGFMMFPNGVEVATVVNSLGGTNTMCLELRDAYNNAWVEN